LVILVVGSASLSEVNAMANAVKYTRTLFEPEHELFRQSYRAFLDKHVAPYHDQWEKDKIVDRGVWLEAGKQGFLGMAVPEEYGGGGDSDFRYNTIVVEETVYEGIDAWIDAFAALFDGSHVGKVVVRGHSSACGNGGSER
jgi:alkylation response protein AidB-like acyl-CoA dehydrogenase